MDAIIWNYEYVLPRMAEALLLRHAYLLADHTIAAGSSRQQYFHYNHQQVPLKEKLNVLEKMYSRGLESEDIKRGIDFVKRFKKLKHPRPDQIGPYKLLERALIGIYDSHMEAIKAHLYNQFVQMDQLAAYGFFDWYHLDTDPNFHIPGEKHVSVADVMELLPEKREGRHHCFFLPSDLFKEDSKASDVPDFSTSFSEEYPGLLYSRQCFELPNLLQFSPNELHIIKLKLQPVASFYHTKTNAWMELCKSNSDAGASFTFFEKEVLPAAQLFNEAISENPLLWKHQKNESSLSSTTISLGEISTAAVWNLFMELNAGPKEGWEKILGRREEPDFTRPLPVMVMCPPTDFISDPAADEGSVHLKKSIIID